MPPGNTTSSAVTLQKLYIHFRRPEGKVEISLRAAFYASAGFFNLRCLNGGALQAVQQSFAVISAEEEKIL